MSHYCEIPIAELTSAMTNRSTSTNSTQMPQVTHGADTFHVLEFEEKHADLTTIFDDYEWYTGREMVDLIENP